VWATHDRHRQISHAISRAHGWRAKCADAALDDGRRVLAREQDELAIRLMQPGTSAPSQQAHWRAAA
jgi:hypothetical protein